MSRLTMSSLPDRKSEVVAAVRRRGLPAACPMDIKLRQIYPLFPLRGIEGEEWGIRVNLTDFYAIRAYQKP